jgi:hypothetical protein
VYSVGATAAWPLAVPAQQSALPAMRMTIKSPAECVFAISGTRTDGTLEVIDFNKATTLRFMAPRDFFAYVEVEGPQVCCEGNKCEDEKYFFMLEQRGSVELEENRFGSYSQISRR